MYTLVYYVRETKETKGLPEVTEREYRVWKWRLRRSALNFIRDLEKGNYREKGYAIEDIKGGIYCYKSEKTTQGERKITEVHIKVEKA